MAPDGFNWSWSSPPDQVELDCLMPNSIYLPLKDVDINSTLRDIKNLIWEQAPKYPLYGKLHDQTQYLFHFINELAVLDELRPDDEGIKLRELKPYFGILRIEERKLEDVDKKLNKDISHLIDYDLNMFDLYMSSEINDFRDKMRENGHTKVMERKNYTWEDWLEYQHPTRVSPVVPSELQNQDAFPIIVYLKQEVIEFNTSGYATPSWLLMQLHSNPLSHILKVCDREEYLLGERPLLHYRYIQETLAEGVHPKLVILKKTCVLSDIPNDTVSFTTDNEATPLPQTQSINSTVISSWCIDQVYTCTVSKVSNLYPTCIKVGVRAGIFYGDKSLCKYENSRESQSDEHGVVSRQNRLQFNIKVSNLPRCAKLCLVVYKLTKRQIKITELTEKITETVNMMPLAWVNTTIFDHRGQLRSGHYSFNMWRYSEDIQSDDFLHPLGAVSSGHTSDTDPVISVEFTRYSEVPVVYPGKMERKEMTKNIAHSAPTSSCDDFTKLRVILESGAIQEEDQKCIWAWRRQLAETAPHLLPKLLECVDWKCWNDVVAVDDVSTWWPELSVAGALQLLDFAHADISVREFAVQCLKKLSDEDLCLYLLQLVQALRHECYLMCDLAILLLERAWNNMHIGHFLFWHLRSEIEVPQVSVRFRLMIEAYCRGSQEHIPGLRRQVDSLRKMKEINEIICECADIDKARSVLREQLVPNLEALSHIYNPLDPAVKCKLLKISECNVMNSKMRPLYLVYDNSDPHSATNVCFIVKKGDDLRQDMLTLQILRFMDTLWKNNGQDFRMSAYGCISMERRVGMIEVVRPAKTIARIQHSADWSHACWYIQTLLEWLGQFNKEKEHKKAIETFTLSCVGYSVATYVLGIADRHSDNIMVKQNGQLFHIDFGHILGNFKKKMGFKRERAPFVMTDDFVYIISDGFSGRKGEDSKAFQIFQQKCEEAFKLLRRNGMLLLTLCSLMISARLPELNSEKDLKYLRNTLMLDTTEEKALDNFRSQFKLALQEAIWTKANWILHYYAKSK